MEVDTKAHAEREEEKRIEALYEYARDMDDVAHDLNKNVQKVMNIMNEFEHKLMAEVRGLGEAVEQVALKPIWTSQTQGTDEFINRIQTKLDMLRELVWKYEHEVERQATEAHETAYDQDWHGPLD